MAISGGDGSIILTTKIDESGLNSGLSKLKSGVGAFGKAFAVAGAAGVAAFAGITKAAVDRYAEFEQLSGGVQKIFDEIDYSKIAADAGEAYKTMGMSANEYLSVMTTVGANFASTLGDAKGYEVAKQGMQAISDFASGTGRSVDELSEKYQMITKSTSSYQSIADQFAGILPATSAGFLEQAQSAGFLSESYTKLTDVPMAEYQEAVTQMLTKGVDALGLTNNAANEATTTLSGSFSMLQGSWSNLLVAFANPEQDLNLAIDDFKDSLSAVADNLLPRIGEVFGSIFGSIPTPILAVASAIGAVVAGITAYNAVMEVKNVLDAIQEAGSIKLALAQIGLNTAMLASPITWVVAGIVALVAAFVILWNKSEGFRNFWIGLWKAVKNVAQKAWEGIKSFFKSAWEGAKSVWEAATDFFSSVWEGIKAVFSVVKTYFEGMFKTAWEAIKFVWDTVVGYFTAIWDSIKNVFSVVAEWFKDVFKTAWEAITEIWDNVVQYFSDLWDSIKNVFNVVGEWFKETFQTAWTNIKTAWENVTTWFGNIWGDIKEKFSEVKEWFKEKFKAAWDSIKGVWNAVGDWFKINVWSKITGIFGGVKEWFKTKFSGAWESIKRVFSNWGSFFGGLWDTVKTKFTQFGTKIGDAIGNAVKSGINGVLSLIERTINSAINLINGAIGLINLIPGVSVGRVGHITIPRLAQGAVIPPNREFLAILGDQKHGTNIEAPLHTIVDAMNIALNNNGSREVIREEHYNLNETELMTILHRLVKGGERLQGKSLISGGAY